MAKKIELNAIEYLTLAYSNVVFVIDALSKKFGRQKVLDALKEKIIQLHIDRGKRMAKFMGDNTLKDLLDHEDQELYLPQELREHNLMEWEIVEKTDNKLEIRVTRCLFAEAFKELGDTELGYVMTCEQDFHFASAFNPEIKLSRTKTLMEGHDCCNHCWTIIGEEECEKE